MSDKFTTEPFFMDSFDHLPIGSGLGYKYNNDKDFTLPGGNEKRETSSGVTIAADGRNGTQCALFADGGLLRKRIIGSENSGGTIGFAFFGEPKFLAGVAGFLRLWSDIAEDEALTVHSVGWIGNAFIVSAGHVAPEEPPHFISYGPFPVTLRTNDWNYLVFGGWAGEVHIPGAFTSHYLRVNGQVLYEAQNVGTPIVEGDGISRYFEIYGREGWKIDDLWMSQIFPRIFGAEDFLPRIPLEPHIRVLKANVDNMGQPGGIWNDFPTQVPGLPLQRYEHIGGLYPDPSKHLISAAEPQYEVHGYENIPLGENIYAVQSCMLMSGPEGSRVQNRTHIKDVLGVPKKFGREGTQGFKGNLILSNGDWTYFCRCDVGDHLTINLPQCPADPGLNDQWCAADFNTAQFGVRNDSGESILFGHGIIEVMTDLPEPKPPETISTIGLHTHHRFTKLWKLVRKDGTTFRFTNHNMDLINPADGFTYTPLLSFLTSAHQRTTGLDPNNLEVQGLIGTTEYNDFLAGKYNGARITEYLIDWQYPWAGVFTATTFILEATSFDGAKWIGEAASISLPLLRDKGHVYGRTCRHILGDDKCKVELTQLEESATVLIVNTNDKTSFEVILPQGLDAFDNPRGVSNYWALGNLTWTSGANSGLKFEVRSDTIGLLPEQATIILQTPTPFDIVAGDAFDITPGCDKLFDTCKTKFENPTDVDCGNTRNFGGFPTIPGKDGVFSPIREADRVFLVGEIFDNPLLGFIWDLVSLGGL